METVLEVQSTIISGNQKEKTMPEYIGNLTKQIAITAESPEEAQKKLLNGEGTTISVNLAVSSRPQQTASNLSAGLFPPK